MQRVKSDKSWSILSNIEIESKYVTMSLDLSCEDVITSGTFMIALTPLIF